MRLSFTCDGDPKSLRIINADTGDEVLGIREVTINAKWLGRDSAAVVLTVSTFVREKGSIDYKHRSITPPAVEH